CSPGAGKKLYRSKSRRTRWGWWTVYEIEVLERNPLQRARLKRQRADIDSGEVEADSRRVLEEGEVDALFRGLQLYSEEKKRQRRHSRTKAAKQYLPDLDGRVYVDHVAPFVLSIYYGGFRPGDLFSLQWQHFSDGFKHITKVLSKTAHHGRQVQRFPLSVPLIQVVETWWEEQGCPSKGYVFSSPRFPLGERMLARSAMRKPWVKIKKLGGLPSELDLYSLRHNFASQLVMAGVDLTAVKNLMGHSSIETTIRHYAHLREDYLQEALRALEGMAPESEP
ncbi:tyrosine-type recombinase/integrase, partial [Halomonas icarae]